jgi:hypothetical protein
MFIFTTYGLSHFTRLIVPHIYLLLFTTIYYWRPGRVVGIATAYKLDGLVIESRWGRDIPHLSRPALRPTLPPVQWIPGPSRG